MAFNRHDVEALVALFDSSVVAVYPDDKWNWSSIPRARSHFKGMQAPFLSITIFLILPCLAMFELDPRIKIHYLVSSTNEQSHIATATVNCSYSHCMHAIDKNYSQLEFAIVCEKIILISYK